VPSPEGDWRFEMLSRELPKVRREIGSVAVEKKLLSVLNSKIPNDPRSRTIADVIAENLMRNAILGDVRAIREISNQVGDRMRDAYLNLVSRTVWSDPEQRTCGDLVALATFSKALTGNLEVFKLIVKLVEE
jgi:hypothetical protein